MSKMDMWTELFVHLRVKFTSAKDRVLESRGTFNFSRHISPVQMQYIVTQESETLQKYLEAKEYDVSLTENSININYVEKHKRKVDMDAVGDDVCSTLVDFLVSYTSKPVIVPLKTEKDLDMISLPQSLKCKIFWAAQSHAYWIAGRHDDVIQGYRMLQEKKKDLWFHVISENIETKEISFSPTVDTEVFDDLCVKFKINTNGRRVVDYSGTFNITDFIDMPAVQFMLKHDMGYCRFCADKAGLSLKVKGDVMEFAHKAEMDCPDLDEIYVILTNFLVNISMIYTQNQVSVPENTIESISLKLKEKVQGQSTFRADCFWSHDRSHVWVAGRKKELPEFYGIIKGIRDSFVFRPEYAQVAVECKSSAESVVKFGVDHNAANDKFSRTIEVHGLDSTLNEDIVLFYFENLRRSGGGNVENIYLKDNIFFVTFEESKAVERVLQRKHKIDGIEIIPKKHTPTAKTSTTDGEICLLPIDQRQGEYRTKEGIIVKVYRDSITNLPVDCIVNAANEQLAHGGGVAYVISRAAGYDFDRESRRYIQRYGQLRVAECCSTTAGNLQYKCVIHTVGPRWHDYRDKAQCLSDLQQSVEVTFKEAERMHFSSIAVPPISSGIFGVPKTDCAEQYYRAIVSYSHRHGQTGSLKEIHIIDIDINMINLIQRTFTQMLSSYDQTTAQS